MLFGLHSASSSSSSCESCGGPVRPDPDLINHRKRSELLLLTAATQRQAMIGRTESTTINMLDLIVDSVFYVDTGLGSIHVQSKLISQMFLIDIETFSDLSNLAGVQNSNAGKSTLSTKGKTNQPPVLSVCEE